jgi:transposase-like protein
MVVKIGGKRMYFWRAVDDEGEVLDMLVQERRNKAAALKLLRKLLRNQGVHPQAIVTDKRASYRAAARELGLVDRHVQVPGLGPEVPRRPRRRPHVFNLQPHLISRPILRRFRADAHQTWAAATAAA